ncbi:ribokinase [Rhizobium sp. Root483D2]|uniref:ribokinase n=1 Tax=Rhizobium sp. Root483D2 TaxID=1736545 RepID=UPI00071518A2|nr:ribokinase [Rhizobium sp. Root483D2]KQY42655.1 ribokinase [Rhizobium sp. Root483D2]
MRVHVVGNVCIDTTFRLDRFPEAGETRNALGHADGLGGKGANQAIAAARTGVPVTLWAAIGRDANGAWICQMLAGEIESACLTDLDLPTDRSTVAVDAGGENIIISGVSCAVAFDPITQTGLLDSIEPGDVLIMQGNLAAGVTSACLRAARAKGLTTVLNASPLVAGVRPGFEDVDIVIVNQGEAEALSGLAVAAEAAAKILELGAHSVVITLGSKGCLLLPGAGSAAIHIEAPRVAAIDTSGAGDVLCGIFAGCLARGMHPQRAIHIAVQASALAVTRAGTLSSCPTAKELSTLIETSETEHP